MHPGFIVICPFASGQVAKQDKAWPAFADFSRALLEGGRDIVACPVPGEERIVASRYVGVKSLD